MRQVLADMTTSRPYLIRAIHEWILDNAMTPYMLVDIEGDGVDVPPPARAKRQDCP